MQVAEKRISAGQDAGIRRIENMQGV